MFQSIEELSKEGVLIAYADLMLSETKAEFASLLANALWYEHRIDGQPVWPK